MTTCTAELRLSFENAADAATFFQHLSQAYRSIVKTISGSAAALTTPKAAEAPRIATETTTAVRDPAPAAVLQDPFAEPAPQPESAASALNVFGDQPQADKPAPKKRGRPKSVSEQISEPLDHPKTEAPASAVDAPAKAYSLDEVRKLGNACIAAKGIGPTYIVEQLKSFGAGRYPDLTEEQRAIVGARWTAKLAEYDKANLNDPLPL